MTLSLFSFFLLILAAGSALFARATPQNASTFIFSESAANLNLSLTAVAETGDLWFRLSAPADYDWVGVGIGAKMKGALTFVTYPTKNGTAITLSPRLSTGNTEPTFNSKIAAYKVDFNNASENYINAANGGVMQIAFVCRNCTNWSNPPLDLSDTQAPFMFAVGPISDQTGMRWSNSPAAPLRSHSIWGQFTMDMTVATVQSPDGISVPTLGVSTVGASSEVTTLGGQSHDYSSAFHAVTMCLAIGLILPLDVVIFKLFRKVRMHICFEAVIMLLFLIGLGLGFYVSVLFVRSKNFNSAHQILGFIMIAVIIADLVLGIMHHRAQLKEEKNPPQMPPRKRKYGRGFIHGILGLLIFLIGVIDAALGFNFALSVGYNKLWVPLVLAVIILLLFVWGFRYCFDTHVKDQQTFEHMQQNQDDAWQRYAEEQGRQRQQQSSYAGYGGYKGMDVEMRPIGGNHDTQYQQVTVPRAY